MAAVMQEPEDRHLRRRNIRLAVAVGVFALACYVGMFVLYLTAAGR